jgi:hypothetical protein
MNMTKYYKSVVVDNEGLQTTLDRYAEQGWTLHSIAPHTMRRVSLASPIPDADDMEELVATYYLLIFFHEDVSRYQLTLEEEKEPLSAQGFSLPDF